jgi:transposase
VSLAVGSCARTLGGPSRDVADHLVGTPAALTYRLSNALIESVNTESVNTKIRLLTCVAVGFRSPQALIALAMLSLGGHWPPLPAGTACPTDASEET